MKLKLLRIKLNLIFLFFYYIIFICFNEAHFRSEVGDIFYIRAGDEPPIYIDTTKPNGRLFANKASEILVGIKEKSVELFGVASEDANLGFDHDFKIEEITAKGDGTLKVKVLVPVGLIKSEKIPENFDPTSTVKMDDAQASVTFRRFTSVNDIGIHLHYSLVLRPTDIIAALSYDGMINKNVSLDPNSRIDSAKALASGEEALELRKALLDLPIIRKE